MTQAAKPPYWHHRATADMLTTDGYDVPEDVKRFPVGLQVAMIRITAKLPGQY